MSEEVLATMIGCAAAWPRMSSVFKMVWMSRHAWSEMRREKIPVEMVLRAYEDPDERRASDHDDLREVRTRWFGDERIEVVVDTMDGRVVTVW